MYKRQPTGTVGMMMAEAVEHRPRNNEAAMAERCMGALSLSLIHISEPTRPY